MNFINIENATENVIHKSEQERINELFDSIVSVCKNDEKFNLKEKLIKINEDIQTIKTKIERNQKLIIETEQLKKNITVRIKNIEQDIIHKRDMVLENLGIIGI